MSKIAEECLPDPNDKKLKNGEFVDAVARLIGGSRCQKLLARCGSREDLVREAKLLLQADNLAGGSTSTVVAGKDMAGQSFA